MNARDVAFVGALVDRVPALLNVLQVHLDDNNDLLPHLFLADVTRWLLREYTADESSTSVRDALEFMEHAYSRTRDHPSELISVSFLENLPLPGAEGSKIREVLGPSLAAQLRIIG